MQVVANSTNVADTALVPSTAVNGNHRTNGDSIISRSALNHKGEPRPPVIQGSLNLATWLLSGDSSTRRELQKEQQSSLLHHGEPTLSSLIYAVGDDGSLDMQRMAMKP